MRNLVLENEQRNALVAVGASVLADVLVAALGRPDVVAAVRAVVAAPVPASDPDPTGLLSRGALGKHLSRSVATVDRLVLEGMPCTFVGDGKRFDLAECRAWLVARGKRRTRTKRADAEVDVTDVVAAAGLRVTT